MPICRSCRGEFTNAEARCPLCARPLGSNLKTCTACGRPTGGSRLCPRCNSDVGAWERVDGLFIDFMFNEGGFLGLSPLLLVAISWLGFLTRYGWSLYYSVLTFLSTGMSLLLFAILYIKRLLWWERWWAAQVYRARNLPIMGVLSASGLLGMLLLALSWFLGEIWGKPESPAQKLLFAFVYVGSFTCLTAMATLFGIRAHAAHLNQHVTPPIFVDMTRLLQVVVNEAKRSINLWGEQEGWLKPDLSDSAPIYEVLSAARSPDTGGLSVMLRELRPVRVPDQEAGLRRNWREVTWRIDSDCWGRVGSVTPAQADSDIELPPRSARAYGRYT